jgi:hypothetical protein
MWFCIQMVFVGYYMVWNSSRCHLRGTVRFYGARKISFRISIFLNISL